MWLPAFLLTTAVANVPSVAFAQQGRPTELWGKAVDGIELHLGLADDAPAHVPSDVPEALWHLEVALHNVGKATVPFSDDTLRCVAGLEVDSVWYGQVCFGNGAANDKVAPGERSRTLRLSFLNPPLFELAAPHKSLALIPGEHSVRVRANVGGFLPNIKVKSRVVVSNQVVIRGSTVSSP